MDNFSVFWNLLMAVGLILIICPEGSRAFVVLNIDWSDPSIQSTRWKRDEQTMANTSENENNRNYLYPADINVSFNDVDSRRILYKGGDSGGAMLYDARNADLGEENIDPRTKEQEAKKDSHNGKKITDNEV